MSAWKAEDQLNAILIEAASIPCDDCPVEDLNLEFPPYYDEKLFKRGQDYYQQNIFAMHTGMFSGLIGVLAVPSILRVLIFTERSGTACLAYRRYFQTILHTALWFDDTLNPNSKSWKSLLMIRKRHLLTGKSAYKHGAGLISQKDMALTQFGFMGFILIRPHLLGIKHDNLKDRQALVHVWRCLGYILGIKEKYNICRESFEETLELCELLLQKVYKPNLTHCSKDFVKMTKILVQGLQGQAPLLEYHAYMFFTKRLADVESYKYLESDYPPNENKEMEQAYKKLGWYSRFSLFLIVGIHSYLLSIPLFRWYYNLEKRFHMIIDRYIPYLAIYKFGWKNAFVDIRVDTYKDK